MSEVRIYRSRKAFNSKKTSLAFDTEGTHTLKISEYTDSESVNSYCFKLIVDDKEYAFCYGKTHKRDEYLSRLLLGIKAVQEYNVPLVNVMLY
jgi:hypothetical protein